MNFPLSGYPIPYKIKYWREAKHKRKYFGGMNIDNLYKIVSSMCLNLQLGVNFNVHLLTK